MRSRLFLWLPSQSRRLPLRDRGRLVWGLVWNTGRVERTNGVSALRGACRGRWPAMADRVWVAAGSSWTKPDCRCRSHSWRPRRPTLGSVPRCDGQEFVPGPRAAVRGLIDQKLGGDIVHLSSKRTWPPRQQLGRENRQSTGVCGASIPFRTHPVRGRGKVPPREKAEKHGREKNSEGARPCTPDAVQEARVQRA